MACWRKFTDVWKQRNLLNSSQYPQNKTWKNFFFILQYDNARTHWSQQMGHIVRWLKIPVVAYPLYRIYYLIPSDFNLFNTIRILSVLKLKTVLYGQNLSFIAKVEDVVHSWINNKSNTFFMDWWKKVYKMCGTKLWLCWKINL